MKHAADLEAATEHAGAVGDSVTGVREATAAHEVDPPTEEIDLAAAELAAPAAEPAPLDSTRKTSVPPPPPPAALRVRTQPGSAPAVAHTITMPEPRAAAVPATGSGPPPLPRVRAARLLELGAENDRLKAELEQLGKRMRERDAYLAELEAVYTQREMALIKAQERLEALEGELARQRERVEELERERDRASQPGAAPAPTPDDLTRIRGIGPRYARMLQEIGVRSFAAIAAWSGDDLASVAARLKVTPSRIVRDGWVDQARALCGGSAEPAQDSALGAEGQVK